MLGTRNLAEILSERESISKVMQDALDEATDLWGVKVHNNAILHDWVSGGINISLFACHLSCHPPSLEACDGLRKGLNILR